ncbi:MAG: hypothetical protein WA005_11150, partial [Candidatus Binataceae bacterium]
MEAKIVIMAADGLSSLLAALRRLGYEMVGPMVRDGAIAYDEIQSADQLPAGWTDVQDAGSYRLRRRDDAAIFGFAVGPHSWKKFLVPPTLRLWSGRRDADGAVKLDEPAPPPQKLALIGVRSCELHAIAIQDKVLIGGRYADPHYAAQRNNLFIVAVNCIEAGGTCFCAPMGTGPRVSDGYDLALTELIGAGVHEFVVEIGSEAGAAAIGTV